MHLEEACVSCHKNWFIKGGLLGARAKLNLAYFQGALIVAAIVGGAFHSWWVFGITAMVLIGGQIAVGEIRLKQK